MRARLSSYERRQRLAIGVLFVEVVEGEAVSGERPWASLDIVGDNLAERISIRVTVTLSRLYLDHICQRSPIGINIV